MKTEDNENCGGTLRQNFSELGSFQMILEENSMIGICGTEMQN